MTRRLLRIDDLGASSKQYEQYARRRWANVGFLKRMPGLKAWGPYPELDPMMLECILAFVDSVGSHVYLAVTACWVEADGTLVPYPDKFPAQADCILRWRARGTVTVVNHGLTHCVVGQHLPRFWTWNRRWHREFVPEVPLVTQEWHLRAAQTLLRGWLGQAPEYLVPPGHIISDELIERLPEFGLRLWPATPTLVFHDRDFVTPGGWENFQTFVVREQFIKPGGVNVDEISGTV